MWLAGNRVARVYRETAPESDGGGGAGPLHPQSPRWRTIAQLARGMLAQDAAEMQAAVREWERLAGFEPPARLRWVNAVKSLTGATTLVVMAGAAAAGGAPGGAAGMGLAMTGGAPAAASMGALAGPAAAAVLSAWPLIAGAFVFGALALPAPKARREWEEKRRHRAEAAAAVRCGGAPPPLKAPGGAWWGRAGGGSSSKRARFW